MKVQKLFHIHYFSNEKKVQRVLKKYPCFFLFVYEGAEKKPTLYRLDKIKQTGRSLSPSFFPDRGEMPKNPKFLLFY